MVKNEESRRSMKIENNPVASSDADSSVASASAVAMTTGPLTPIQQQPSGQTRRVRDELDPAPHHTPSDIRVLEILKRIRDEGNVGDEDCELYFFHFMLVVLCWSRGLSGGIYGSLLGVFSQFVFSPVVIKLMFSVSVHFSLCKFRSQVLC